MLTNKYAEGYPGKRYYGGCEVVDEVETARHRAGEGAVRRRARQRAAPLGLQANQAVYFAALEPGDTVLAMRLEHGGHLTHGLKVNFSGRAYTFHHYGVARGHGAHRLRPGARAGPRAASAHDRRRAPAPTRASSTSPPSARSPTRWAPCSWSTWPTSPAWWRRACTRRRSARRVGHHHHPQDARRPARAARCSAAPVDAAALDKAVFPGLQGGPLEHVIAGKAVCFKLAAHPGVQRAPARAPCRQRPGARRRADGRRSASWCRAAPTTT